MQKLDAQSLKALGLAQQNQQAQPTPCSCALGTCPGWESFTEERWPQAQMRKLGSLRDPEVYEPTQQEHHPDGTRYASADAPIAVNFFPYNLCDAYACDNCQKVLLRYTEFGGYYVDHRVRELDANLAV